MGTDQQVSLEVVQLNGGLGGPGRTLKTLRFEAREAQEK